jgi:hypothetical protein
MNKIAKNTIQYVDTKKIAICNLVIPCKDIEIYFTKKNHLLKNIIALKTTRRTIFINIKYKSIIVFDAPPDISECAITSNDDSACVVINQWRLYRHIYISFKKNKMISFPNCYAHNYCAVNDNFNVFTSNRIISSKGNKIYIQKIFSGGNEIISRFFIKQGMILSYFNYINNDEIFIVFSMSRISLERKYGFVINLNGKVLRKYTFNVQPCKYKLAEYKKDFTYIYDVRNKNSPIIINQKNRAKYIYPIFTEQLLTIISSRQHKISHEFYKPIGQKYKFIGRFIPFYNQDYNIILELDGTIIFKHNDKFVLYNHNYEVLKKLSFMMGSRSIESDTYKFINDRNFDSHLINEIFNFLSLLGGYEN